MVTRANFPPGWIPCSICLKPLGAHYEGKCPFDSTNFSPWDAQEVWETYHDAMQICSYETRTSLLDLSDEEKVRYYMEARKQRLLKQIKERR